MEEVYTKGIGKLTDGISVINGTQITCNAGKDSQDWFGE